MRWNFSLSWRRCDSLNRECACCLRRTNIVSIKYYFEQTNPSRFIRHSRSHIKDMDILLPFRFGPYSFIHCANGYLSISRYIYFCIYCNPSSIYNDKFVMLCVYGEIRAADPKVLFNKLFWRAVQGGCVFYHRFTLSHGNMGCSPERRRAIVKDMALPILIELCASYMRRPIEWLCDATRFGYMCVRFSWFVSRVALSAPLTCDMWSTPHIA